MKRIAVACAVFLSAVLLCACVSMSESNYDKAIRDAYDEGYRAAEQELSESCYQAGYDDGYRDGLRDGYETGEYEGRENCEKGVRWYADLLFMTQEELQAEYDNGVWSVEEIIGLYGRAREKMLSYGLEG